MYLPTAFEVADPAKVRGVLAERRFGHLVSVGAEVTSSGLVSTPLPFVVDGTVSSISGHLSRANPHWRRLDGVDALLIVPTVDAYVSPRWYPSKAEHGKVVPTWNYEVVHVHGRVRVHDDADWLRGMLDQLTDHNEQTLDATGPRWMVSDAPAEFIDNQLRAIVGVELVVTQVQAKQKLSQNRSDADRLGALDGLGASADPGDQAVSKLMASTGNNSPAN